MRPGKPSASLYGAIALNVVALIFMGVITYALGDMWITDYWGPEWTDVGVYFFWACVIDVVLVGVLIGLVVRLRRGGTRGGRSPGIIG